MAPSAPGPLLSLLCLAASALWTSGIGAAFTEYDKDAGVVLEAEFSRSTSHIHVAYTVRNLGTGRIGVFRRLTSPNGITDPQLSPNYVFRSFEEGTLHLQILALVVPPGVEMAERPFPFVSRLEPGESLHDEFLVSIPVTVNDPVHRARLGARPGHLLAAACAASARRVLLSIGVFAVDMSLQFIPLSSDYPALYRVWPPGPVLKRQRVLTVGAELATDLPVLDFCFVPR